VRTSLGVLALGLLLGGCVNWQRAKDIASGDFVTVVRPEPGIVCVLNHEGHGSISCLHEAVKP